jgi:hypothetical protein
MDMLFFVPKFTEVFPWCQFLDKKLVAHFLRHPVFFKKRKKTTRIVRPPILIFTMLYVAEMFCSHLATYPNFLL